MGVLLGQGEAPWIWIAFWLICLATTALAAFRPALALGAYAATLYATPRYSRIFDELAASNILHVETLLIAAGTAFWVKSHRERILSGSKLLWMAVALGIWIAVAFFASEPLGPRSIYAARHDPTFFIHAIVLCVAAAHILDRPASWRDFVLPLCAAVVIRGLWQGPDGLRLEGDVGPLAVMVLPLALWLARSDPSRIVKVAASSTVVAALAIVGLSYNRAAAVALGLTLVLLVWQYRRQRWLVAVALLAILTSAVWLAYSPYLDRFQRAWVELTGGATGSVTERFALWRAGFAIVADHPVVGVGLGNYSKELATYAPQLQGLVAHNSYVHVAAETGLPGLVLYAGLFVTAGVVAGLVARRDGARKILSPASAVQASLVAYLAAGFFISRHDMVLAYILVGWVAALASRGPRGDTPEPSPNLGTAAKMA
jgi:O-antigen ligase